MANHLKIRKDVPSATITIDRPDCHNALTPKTIQELQTAFDDFRVEKKVRGVILTGSGESFCAGTDLRHLHEQMQCPDPESFWQNELPDFAALIESMLRYPKPIIAAPNGAVCGSGMALMLACDYIVCGPTSYFQLPECKVGLLSGAAIPLLLRRSSIGVASRLAFSGKKVDVGEALQNSIVDEVLEDHLLWARANELVGQFSIGNPSSHQLTRQLLNDTISEALFTQIMIGAANTAAARSTEGAMEGVQAFIEKRIPKWP